MNAHINKTVQILKKNSIKNFEWDRILYVGTKPMDNFDDKESEKMRRMKNVRRSITGILACAVLSTALCACGSSSASSGSYKNAAADTGAYYDEPMAAAGYSLVPSLRP